MKRFALLVFPALVGALCLLCLTQAASAQCYGWGCDGRPVWQNPVYGHPWRYYGDSGYYPYHYAPPVQQFYHQAYRHPYPYAPVYRPVTRSYAYGGYHYYDHRGYQHGYGGYGGWGGRGGWTTQWRGRWW